MTTTGTERPNARTTLLVTAERMIAEQGPAVSLREIAVAAGQRNNAAVQYHFGSREALIEAIIELRQESLERERVAILATQEVEGRADLRSLVEALFGPLFTTPYAEGATHYARFLEKVRDLPTITALGEHNWSATTLIVTRMNDLMSELPRPIREQRLRSTMTTMFALLADLERSGETTPAVRARAEQNLIDMVLGMLTAPSTTR
jgi:AcrR family transcriptional regulator